MIPKWSTACPDWEQRIVEGRSLIPFAPLFPEEARQALEVFNSLKLISVLGEPTFAEAGLPWLKDLVQALFGSYDSVSGQRLIQHYMLLVAKKNGKSESAAGIMMTALIRNFRKSGQFSILSPTKQIADNSFLPALDMVRHDNNLAKFLHVKENQRIILHRNTGASLKVVAADSEAVGGGKNIGLLVDELWLFGKREEAERMLTEATGGLASRPEGFVIYSTTQSDKPPAGVFLKTLDRFRAIRDGKIVDNTSLPILFEYPSKMIKEKAYLDSKTFYIPNPNLGASVSEQNILNVFEKAKQDGPAALADFLAKRLNVEIGMGLRSDGWAGAHVWSKGEDKTLKLESLIERSEVLIVSLDGGGLDDLLGLGVMGREAGTNNWLDWNLAFISPIGMERRKANEPVYQDFIDDGDLIFVEELPDDVMQLIEIVRQCKDSGKLHCVGADPAGLGILVDALNAIGITEENGMLVGVKQGVALMGAIKAVERKLADGTFKHAGQPIMAWCAGNAVSVPTPTGMRIARDESGYGKIDPLMATFNCAALMSLNPESAAVPEIYFL